MHRLLLRQIRKHLPDDVAARPELAAFLSTLSSTYEEFEQNQTLAEHTLAVVSDELTEANRRLHAENESRLAELNRYYRQTLELQQGMILCVEHDGRDFRHTLCCGRLVARLGWSAAAVVGRRPDEFLPPATAALLRGAYAAAWAGEECQVEFVSADGGVACLASLCPRVEDGRVREVIVSGVEVTELKQAQAETQKLALVAERTDNAVVLTDVEGRIEWINAGFTRITGYEFAEVIGRKPGSFLQGPDTSPEVVRLMHERVANGEGFSVEVVNYGKHGRKYWLAIEVRPIRDAAGRLTHYMAVESDITARRQAEDSLRVQFRLSQALAGCRSLRDASQAILSSIGRESGWRLGLLWAVTPEGDALVCADHWPAENCPAPDLLSYCGQLRLARGEALPGRTWESARVEWCGDLGNAPDSACAARAIREGLRGSVAIPIRAGGDVLGVVEFFSGRPEEADESRLLTCGALGAQIGQFYERMHAEEALRRRGEELVRANADLARASRHKNAFLASMSHELRTPLNSVLGLTESLLERFQGPLTDRQARYLELVAQSGRHLLELINDILDLAKIESGQQNLECQVVSLAELCRQSVQLVLPMAKAREQLVDCELPTDSLRADVDPRRLKQILVNLLGNAVKFTPVGGCIGLRVDVGEDGARLAVWDRGIGISAEDMPRLFMPFHQLDARLNREYSGTGLGLSLVKELAALHGGRVEVDSRPGEGSTFTVILPASRIVRRRESPVREPLSSEPVPSVRADGALILLAEDVPMNIIPVRDYLELKGYRVALAGDGRQAIEQTRALRPDLILMDLQMPGFDGLAAAREIRALADRSLASTPIIAVTALAMDHDREICIAAGMDDYVAKPCSLRELHERIGALLAKKRGRA